MHSPCSGMHSNGVWSTEVQTKTGASDRRRCLRSSKTYTKQSSQESKDGRRRTKSRHTVLLNRLFEWIQKTRDHHALSLVTRKDRADPPPLGRAGSLSLNARAHLHIQNTFLEKIRVVLSIFHSLAYIYHLKLGRSSFSGSLHLDEAVSVVHFGRLSLPSKGSTWRDVDWCAATTVLHAWNFLTTWPRFESFCLTWVAESAVGQMSDIWQNVVAIVLSCFGCYVGFQANWMAFLGKEKKKVPSIFVLLSKYTRISRCS